MVFKIVQSKIKQEQELDMVQYITSK